MLCQRLLLQLERQKSQYFCVNLDSYQVSLYEKQKAIRTLREVEFETSDKK